MRKLKVREGIVAVVVWAAVAVLLSGCPQGQQRRGPQTKGPTPNAEAKADETETSKEEEKTDEAPAETAKSEPEEGKAPEGGVADENSDPIVDEPESTPEIDPDNPSGLPLLPNPLLEAAIKEAEATKHLLPKVEEPKIPEMGEPLVENRQNLTRFQRDKPLWVDKKGGRVVMLGRVCQIETLLEMFACLFDTKEHEAIVTIDVLAMNVHTGLVLIGADVGNTVKWDPKYVPASGSEIEITLHWKDAEGKVQTARAQDWIRDTQTKKTMTYPFVFAGSGFWKDEQTGETHYQAEGGDFICVSNFPTAMLDLPIESTQATNGLMFEAFTERIPPRHTPVTLVLTVVEKDEPAEKAKAEPEDKEAEKGKAEPEDKEKEDKEKEDKGEGETSEEPPAKADDAEKAESQ